MLESDLIHRGNVNHKGGEEGPFCCLLRTPHPVLAEESITAEVKEWGQVLLSANLHCKKLENQPGWPCGLLLGKVKPPALL